MLNNETKRKLNEMGLMAIIDAFEAQRNDITHYGNLSFEDRLVCLIDMLYQAKYNERIKRRLKQAHLRIPSADIRSIFYEERKLDKELILELATCDFIDKCTNVDIEGFTGSGKTYLAAAIGKEACYKDITTLYIRMQDLLALKAEYEMNNKLSKLVVKIVSPKLLILDEWLAPELSQSDVSFLLEIFERRYDYASTIFSTQYHINHW